MSRAALLYLLGLVWLAAWQSSLAWAQVAEQPDGLPPADVEQLDSTGAAHLENAKRFLAEGQWEQAVESIRRVQESDAEQLVKVSGDRWPAGFERYVPASEYCQWRLAALASEAPPALAHYRRLVDALAEQWYREGIENRDKNRLALVVEKAFASSWGDDALLALGDLELAGGRPLEALAAFNRIRPEAVPVNDQDSAALPAGWAYPDSEIPAADLQARRILAFALAGSLAKAQTELEALRRNSPDAMGALAGKSGKYVDLLSRFLEDARQWPAVEPAPGWATLGGDLKRGKHAARDIDPAGRPLWSLALPRLSGERELLGAGRLRVAEDAGGLLSYHPVIAGNLVLVRCDARRNSYVIALDLKTGEEQWRVDYRRAAAGADDAREPGEEGPFEVSDAHADLARYVGVGRYTLSVDGERAFVRMGSPITTPSARRMSRWLAKDQGFLLGLDLPAQGKPLEGFPIRPESSAWAFEGAPVSDGSLMYTVMRRSDGARSQLFVAGYELLTTAVAVDDDDDDARPSGRLKWRTRIASATIFGSENDDSLSHLLLTLHDGTLLLNTSAGVVAAIRPADGQFVWLLKYLRVGPGGAHPDRDERHVFRDLTPCLAWKDLVVVAPADCDRLFAVRAATGELAWTLPPDAAADAVHLLGVGQDSLIASGDRLYWIDAETGRLQCQYPQGTATGVQQAVPAPRGYGRGVLAGNHIYFPTRESILVFDQRPLKTDFGWQPRLLREIPLAPRGITGGNLVIANGILLIASADRLVALAQ